MDIKFTYKRTIWVKPYCPVIKIYKKHFKEKEKSFSQNLTEKYLRAQDGSNGKSSLTDTNN